MDKPEFCTDEHLKYLDELRESGSTNMFGAASWLRNAFPELDRKLSQDVLTYWARTFSERHPQ